MTKTRAIIISLAILIFAGTAAVFAYPQRVLEWFPWRPYSFGLDIAGGTSLIYIADVSDIDPALHSEAMDGLADVITRRVDIFGVLEPRIEVARSGEEWRLLVELAGIKDVREAIRMIGDTPFLEFREEIEANVFARTELTGRYLSRAEFGFDPQTREPVVNLQFNPEGARIFGEITERNVGERVAIVLLCPPDCEQDPVTGELVDRTLTAPVVREAIPGGTAQISGGFTVNEARELARRLNQGALPVPISLASQRTVGATLGEWALAQSANAGIIGFALVAIIMILLYRGAGIIAVLALIVYVVIILALFKLIPVTLTLAGIAGFILSIGMAVDANILIFERTKEELRRGRTMAVALREGFSRAWPSIRDSNITTIISAIVLYTFAPSLIKGFALTLIIGVLVSMFSAIVVTRLFLASAVRGSAIWWFGVKGLA
jgi:protein-export membrane protein SecD